MPMTASMPSPCSSDSPEPGFLGSEDLNRLIEFALLGALAGSQPLAEPDHEEGADDFRNDLHRGADFADLVDDENVGNQHPASNPAQQTGAESDDQQEAVDE